MSRQTESTPTSDTVVVDAERMNLALVTLRETYDKYLPFQDSVDVPALALTRALTLFDSDTTAAALLDALIARSFSPRPSQEVQHG